MGERGRDGGNENGAHTLRSCILTSEQCFRRRELPGDEWVASGWAEDCAFKRLEYQREELSIRRVCSTMRRVYLQSVPPIFSQETYKEKSGQFMTEDKGGTSS